MACASSGSKTGRPVDAEAGAAKGLLIGDDGSGVKGLRDPDPDIMPVEQL